MAEHAVLSPPPNRATGPVFAALDLGTNNCRLLVGTQAGRGFAVLDSFSRIIRLGEGLECTGRLSQAAMERALAALAACAAQLSRHALSGFTAVATEACRRAANGAEFLAHARAETGIALSVISTREETELAVESCASLLAPPHAGPPHGALADARALLFDIGGGSTELAWLRLDRAGRPRLIGCASIPIGVVTFAERYGAAAFTRAGFATMVAEAAALLAPFEAVHCIAREIRERERNGPGGAVRLLGTSGTATTLAALALALPRYSRHLVDGTILSRETALQGLARLAALDRGALEQHPCIGPERAPFALPGAAIFAALEQAWPCSRMIVADRGLREGLLLRLIRAHHPAHPCR